MRQNALKHHLKEGRHAINGWLHVPSSLTAEALAHQGFDCLTLDLQHGPYHFEAALAMLQAISTTPVTPLARVPWNEPGIIMKLLDAGCYGIICPMISTRAEAEAFVAACRYPPTGYRSFGPTRVRLYAGADYAKHANDEVLTFAMIETQGALANLEAIISTPGLDGIYVGPADLSQALGGPAGVDFETGDVVAALDEILALARAYDVIPGIYTGSARYAKAMINKGFKLVTVQSDLLLMLSAAQSTLAALNAHSEE